MSITIFEATAAIGEVFRLRSIDRSGAKKEFKQHLRKQEKDDYVSQENTPLIIEAPKTYIPPLECRINYYRTCIHLIGSALITMIQTYMKSISLEQIDLRTREVKEILERLPPMYLKVKADVPLSSYTSKLLEDYPPNKLQFPLAPTGDKGDSVQCRSGKVVHKESSGKAVAVDKALESVKNKKYVEYSFHGSLQKSILNVFG
ncbi:hypothetical protein Aduo_005726 [Ancylostoma duodenale]